MGRKSSSKGQSQHPASASPQEKARSLFAPIAIGGAVLLAAIGLMVYSGGGGGAIEPQATATAQNMTPVEPAYAKFGPHKQAVLPPFPFDTEPPIRPQQVINAAYTFAAEHPEVLAYVPCYCGCERAGHRGNDDCFVMARAANGDVTRWEPHGMTWAVCIDVARDAMQMHASGASVRDIRIANEKKWTPTHPTQTPTPQPPSK